MRRDRRMFSLHRLGFLRISRAGKRQDIRDSERRKVWRVWRMVESFIRQL